MMQNVKEEQLEEEEEDVRSRRVTLGPAEKSLLNDTVVSSNIESSQRQADESTVVKETPEQVKERCKERIDNYKRDTKKAIPLSD
jgi:hypothetical protein